MIYQPDSITLCLFPTAIAIDIVISMYMTEDKLKIVLHTILHDAAHLNFNPVFNLAEGEYITNSEFAHLL